MAQNVIGNGERARRPLSNLTARLKAADFVRTKIFQIRSSAAVASANKLCFSYQLYRLFLAAVIWRVLNNS